MRLKRRPCSDPDFWFVAQPCCLSGAGGKAASWTKEGRVCIARSLTAFCQVCLNLPDLRVCIAGEPEAIPKGLLRIHASLLLQPQPLAGAARSLYHGPATDCQG